MSAKRINGGAVLSLIVLALLFSCICNAPDDTKTYGAVIKETLFLKQNECLGDLLIKRTSLDQNLAYSIIASLETTGFDFKKCRPGDTLTFVFHEKTLYQMEYKRDYRNIYIIKPDTDGIWVSMVYKPLTRRLEVVRGEISSSFYESMLALGEEPGLVFDYADIFQWSIDFFTESQSGDSFAFVVERIYNDTLPVDHGRIRAAHYAGDIGEYHAFYFKNPDGIAGYYNQDGESMKRMFLRAPLHYRRISSYFSYARYHPILKIVRPHYGIDYAAPTGTPVSAIGDGSIVYCGWKGGYGRYIAIRHPKGFVSGYGHLSRFTRGMRKGTYIRQGDVIGYVGSTGLSTGPHLDFSIRQHGKYVNPLRLTVPRSDPVQPQHLQMFEQERDRLLSLYPAGML